MVESLTHLKLVKEGKVEEESLHLTSVIPYLSMLMEARLTKGDFKIHLHYLKDSSKWVPMTNNIWT